MSGCNCGSTCGCGSNCGCGKMYPDIDVEKSTAQTIIIEGVAPVKMYSEGSEASFVTEGGHACKCGSNCTCNPCNC